MWLSQVLQSRSGKGVCQMEDVVCTLPYTPLGITKGVGDLYAVPVDGREGADAKGGGVIDTHCDCYLVSDSQGRALYVACYVGVQRTTSLVLKL